jgi:hypothetical protein
MRQFWKRSKKVTLLAAAALVLVLGVSVGTAMAYFTTYATAKGGVPITLGAQTSIHEEYGDWTKTISVENTGDVPVFVRAKVLAGSRIDVTITGTNWSLGKDGYWYYSEALPVGGTTANLVASIEKNADVTSSFNVAVVQECTPVMYDADGNAVTAENADWNMKAQYTYTGKEADK